MGMVPVRMLPLQVVKTWDHPEETDALFSLLILLLTFHFIFSCIIFFSFLTCPSCYSAFLGYMEITEGVAGEFCIEACP